MQQPMLSLFRHRLFSPTALIGLLVNVALYGLIFMLSLYCQQVNGVSAFATGLPFVPMMGVHPAGELVGTSWPTGLVSAGIAGGAAIATGCLGLIVIAHDSSYWAMAAQLRDGCRLRIACTAPHISLVTRRDAQDDTLRQQPVPAALA